MRTVKISDLKARLSAHIQFVKDGEEVLVCERDKPVARIVPCDIEDKAGQRRLVATGVLIPPQKKRSETLTPDPVGNVSDEVMEQVRRREREGR